MRELVLGSGGRRLYNEDLDDLQNNLLAISQIFASENPFVISGIEFTEVSTNVHDVSAGYVWLGGKIRQYGGTTNLDTSTTLPFYIVVSDLPIPRMYDNNTNLPATNVYGTLSSTDITLVAPNDYLRIDDIVNIDRYYENIIGDNYLKLDFSQTQEVKGDVVLLSTLASQSSMTVSGNITSSSEIRGNTITSLGEIYSQYAITSNTSIHANGGISSQQDIRAVGILSTQSDLTVSGNSFIQGTTTSGTYKAFGQGIPTINADGTIGDDFVDNNAILPEAITSGKIAPNQIGLGHMTDDSVGTAEIVYGSVTGAEIGSNTIESRNIKTYGVEESDLADNSVSSRVMGVPMNVILAHGTKAFNVNSGQRVSYIDINGFGDVGISNYRVLITQESVGDNDIPITHCANNKTSSSFKIGVSNFHDAIADNSTGTLYWQIFTTINI